ncbi:hypothetical protein SARC_00184 [Sphaeroforma arctica JP610]|uniref:Uncharacterized protein n=1 Tax=Sphaeroforma arctica JP610 TaxID=667725 RepID=A0A0L0GFB6_9EUKA|nr:hypothetical protein SARC_00184 [Sphaeroforma arctica JP610]KNC87750.1 hypothetical protein SARC_00184 [Sphaeroforma arctica JP610]|eukprot:XP_014161652.1 hypothetical protein SARC_00184 [Sphaeroforma arctica JP610]
MNNIVQSFTQAKLALTPFGEEASRAVEIAVEAGVDGKCVDDGEVLSKWQMTVVNEFKHVFQSLYMTLMTMVNRLNNQMRTVLGDQIRVILGSKGGTSRSIRVKGLQQINETSEKVVESSKRMAKWLKLSSTRVYWVGGVHSESDI